MNFYLSSTSIDPCDFSFTKRHISLIIIDGSYLAQLTRIKYIIDLIRNIIILKERNYKKISQ